MPQENSKNPHRAPWLDEGMIRTVESLRRIDRDGLLYEMNCVEDYASPVLTEIMRRYGLVRAGCSVFMTQNPAGETLTCRNYDYHHRKYNQKDGEATGLNVVVHCAPSGKYRSVGTADAFWLDGQGGTFFAGTPDDGQTDISIAALLPYICMDGMNEKGLTVSILSQPIRQGETCVHQDAPGKAAITYTVFMRRLLDECADVPEAVALAGAVNMQSPNGADYRIFVSDRNGRSVALEWRYQTLSVVETNLSTNFYTAYDDAEPRYRDGVLYENVLRVENATRSYHYGYGGGYQRFACLLAQLERYIDRKSETYRTVMTEKRAAALLGSAAQNAGPDATSMTQYSVIYNSSRGTASLWVQQKYDTEYTFTIEP